MLTYLLACMTGHSNHLNFRLYVKVIIESIIYENESGTLFVVGWGAKIFQKIICEMIFGGDLKNAFESSQRLGT